MSDISPVESERWQITREQRPNTRKTKKQWTEIMDCERAEPAESKGHSSGHALFKIMFLKSADR